jgi:hypothetical protein|tara:strand:+ start:458 stop:793 length:336 start_codon:yes stop_codon:yes gene_type:complete
LSAAEREARLREMQGAAAAHEAQRQQRSIAAERQHQRDVEAEAKKAEQAAVAAAARGEDGEEARASFLDEMARGSFSNAGINSVAEHIQQQKHYSQRGNRASAESFMRPSQ